MKNVINFLVVAMIFMATFQLKAQYIPHDSIGTPFDYNLYLDAIEEKCPAPVSEVAAVVLLQTGATAYLRFAEPSGKQYQLSEVGAGFKDFSTENGAVVLTGLALEKEFTVYAQNGCSESVPVASFSTKTGKKLQGIEVSNAMYGLISLYQSLEQPPPFPQYLGEASAIHIAEKVSFIQNYYLNGRPLPYWDGTTYNGYQLPPYPGEQECICQFVLNRSKNITPTDNGGERLADGSISPNVEEEGEDHLPGATAGHTKWWAVKSSKGAARYHQLWTEGFKAGGANQSYLIDDTNNGSPNFTSATNASLLRYNLFCQNLAYLPEECECEKPLRLYYGYDVEVMTRAEKRNGGVGARSAFAAGHDISAAVFHVDGSNNYGVMRTMDVRHDSECERKVNSDFWANWGLVAIRAAGAIYALRDPNFTKVDSIIFAASSNNFANALRTAASTNYWASNGCDDNGQVSGFMSGDTLVNLKPNEPVTLYVFAYGKLQTGGKRSWHATARILSDFYLAGYLPGGPLPNQELHCCSPKIADWLLASIPGAPAGESTLKTRVSTIFTAFAPWNIASNASLLTEWGHDIVQVHEDCDLGTDEPGDPGNVNGGGDDRSNKTEISVAKYQYYLFDQTGRFIWQTEAQTPIENAVSYIRHNKIQVETGIYFLRCVNGQTSHTEKIIIH